MANFMRTCTGCGRDTSSSDNLCNSCAGRGNRNLYAKQRGRKLAGETQQEEVDVALNNDDGWPYDDNAVIYHDIPHSLGGGRRMR